MQIIRANCPQCAGIELAPERFSVTEHEGSPELSRYSFTCPKCLEIITKPAGTDVLGLLAAAKGVRWSVVQTSPELAEWHHAGPPLTEDDVANFAIDLALAPAHLIAILAGGDK